LTPLQPGDTLWKIAQREGVKLAALKDENLEILNPDKIYPGQTIHITG
jgi:LysM repeat protein